ncbi:MAG: hypothetical protein WC824_15430 [Bacteroidota bacterium]|jgi:hypothetical protein
MDKTLLDYKKLLLEALTEAQKQRRIREDWIQFERKVMWAETNRFRNLLGRGPVLETEIIRVESLALGHTDYSERWALYCAELVLS